MQLTALFVTSNQAVLFDASYLQQSHEEAKRMNRALAAGTRYKDEYHAQCSGLGGSAIGAPYIARLVYWLMAERGVETDAEALAQAGWGVMRTQGRHLVKDGVRLEDDTSNLAELQSHVRTVMQEQLPVWRKLSMV